MKAVFIDASESLGDVTERLRLNDDMPISVNRNPDITPDEIPAVVGDADVIWVDHT